MSADEETPYWLKWPDHPGRPDEGDYCEELAIKLEAHAEELGRTGPLYYPLYSAADHVRHLGWIQRAERRRGVPS